MTTRQNKNTDPKGGPQSHDKGGRERAGEKSAGQQQRDDEGQFGGKRGKLDDPRAPRQSENLEEDTDAEGAETFERGTEDEEGDEGVARDRQQKPAGRRPQGGP
jgi:hypothetical protein